MEASLTKFEKNKDIYYTLKWTNLKKADRFEIIKQVPALPGIYEIYYQDKYKKLNLLISYYCWFNSLRNTLREKTDPSLETNPKIKTILDNCTCYYRYAVIDSYQDIQDVMFFFEQRLSPEKQTTQSSGRYESIYINEVSPDKIINV